MILEGYLLYNQIKKRNVDTKSKNKEIVFAATNDEKEDDDSSTGIGVLIFLVILIIVSLIIAIACAYFLYSCIKSQCMGFLVFVLIVILLNVPFINIAIFFILLMWWLMKCRKGNCS